jgi:predicted nucleotidyltransferase
MDSILQTLERLNKSGVEYVLIGGMAARVHGSSVNTDDVDICILARDEHFQRIVESFADVHPRFRMQPNQPPVTPDHPWLSGIKNLYLHTDLGQLDVLGELPGIGGYEAIRDRTVAVDLDATPCRVLDIPTLIEAKQHAGRPKDHQAILELQYILSRIEDSNQAEREISGD